MKKIKTLLTILCACMFAGAFSACNMDELFSDVSNASFDSAALDSLSEWLESNTSEVASDHTHEWTFEIVSKAATCEGAGENICFCQCGASYTKEIPALGHSFTDYVSDNNATCMRDGTKTATCDNGCGKTHTKTDVGSMTDHVYEEIVTPATCTTQGYTTYICDCGYSYIGDFTPAKQHEYTTVVTPATCFERGYTTYTCGCGYSYTGDYTQKLDHSFTDYVSNNDATCTADGTKTAYCDNGCGESDTIADVGSMKAHTHVGVVTSATCTAQGYTTYTCGCGDSYVGDYTDIIPHSFTNYIPNGDSTCTEAGTKTAYCDYDCGASDTLPDVGAAGHHYTETVIDPTCITPGYTIYTCDCGDRYMGDYTANLEHKLTNYISNGDATCTKNGTKTAYCDYGCGNMVTIPDIGSKLSHSYTNYTPNGDATCEEDGTKTAYCDYGCGNSATLPDIGSATGHHYAERVVDPTCTAQGYTMYTCDCGASYRGNYTAMISHSYTYYVSNDDATCTADGTRTAYCDYNCGMSSTIVDTGSKFAHSYTNYVSNGDATCMTDGTKTAYCDYACGASDTLPDVGSATGHHFVGGECACGAIEWRYDNLDEVFSMMPYAIIRSVEELNAYFEQYNQFYEQDIVDAHGADYFANNALVFFSYVYSGGSPAEYSYEEKTPIIAGGSITIPVEKTVGEYCAAMVGAAVMTHSNRYLEIAKTSVENCTAVDVQVTLVHTYPIHSYGYRQYNETQHWYACPCGDIDETTVESHGGGTATCQSPAICSVCRQTYGEIGEHTYVDNVCTVCGDMLASEGLEFTLNDDGVSYSVTGIGTCTDTDLIIPSTYNGLPVTSIGYKAFEWCTGLISVEIPDSVTNIDEGAFYHCDSLSIVKIPASVTNIDGYAFYLSEALTSVYITDIASWCNITFGDGGISNPLYHAHNLYLNNELVTELVIPDSVTSISNKAFYRCTPLTSVIIPDSVTSIGSSAFSDCTSLTSVVIPDSVTSIGAWAFSDCRSLTSVEIPDSVTSIGDGAFYNCTSLTSVEIPDSVTSIGYEAFYNCTSLTSVEIGDSVTSIGNSAFENCFLLTNAIIGASVTSIDYNAFNQCYRLVEIYNKSSLAITAGNSAYGKVGYYAKAIYTESYTSRLSTTDDGYILYTDGELVSLIMYKGEETDLVLPANLTEINQYAFWKCDSLTSVAIPDSVTSIDEWAFAYCDSLTSVEMPDSLTSMGDYAFRGCASLISVVIGEAVTRVGTYALLGCDSLTNIAVSENNTAYQSIDGNLYTKGGIKLIQYAIGKTDTSFTIPDSVYIIDNYAFSGCDSLTSVVIPDSVINIESYAFEECYSLTSVTIGNSVRSIGLSAFYDTVYYNDESNWDDDVLYIGNYLIKAKATVSGNYTIKEGTLCIADYAFSWSNSLTDVVIPDSVTYIGDDAFNCDSLANVYYKGTAEEWSRISIGWYNNPLIDATRYYYSESQPTEEGNWWHYVNGVPTVWEVVLGYQGLEYTLNDDGVSYSVTGIGTCTDTDIVIQSTCNDLPVTGIGDLAFSSCTSLTSVEIPDSVTSIGLSAFNGCTALADVEIGSSVTTINNYAFKNCSALTSLVIPDSVTNIGQDAFRSCASLENLTLGKSITDIGSDAFDWCTALTYIRYEITDWKRVGSITSIFTYAGRSGDGLTLSIASNVKKVASFLFDQSHVNLVNIIFEEDCVCEEIGEWAFAGCAKITSLQLPNSVTTIGDYAFNNCDALTSILIPDSVTSIGKSAFGACDSLDSVEVGKGVTDIGSSAFAACISLRDIVIGESVVNIGNLAFSGCTNLIWLTIPDSVVTIGEEAFYGCKLLSSVVVGESVSSIGNYAFGACGRLVEIFNKSSLNIQIMQSDHGGIGRYAYIVKNSINSSKITLNDDGYILFDYYGINIVLAYIGRNTVIDLSEVDRIYEGAFNDFADLTGIVISDSVTSIGQGAFYNCTSLASVYYKGTMETWDSIEIENIYNENQYLLDATRYYYSENQPTEAGNWWHYVDGVPTVW